MIKAHQTDSPLTLRPLQVRKLLELPEGWDSYGAGVISDEAISGAAEVLAKLKLPSEAPRPNVVPGSSGSVQLEWHGCGVDVEIHISPAGAAAALLCDRGEDYEFEMIGREAAERIRQVLSRLRP